jgi:hypothetical protein
LAEEEEKEHSPTGVEFFGRELEELRVGLGRGECQEGGKKERERKEGGLPAGVCVQRQLGDRWNKLGAFSSSRLLVWLGLLLLGRSNVITSHHP